MTSDKKEKRWGRIPIKFSDAPAEGESSDDAASSAVDDESFENEAEAEPNLDGVSTQRERDERDTGSLSGWDADKDPRERAVNEASGPVFAELLATRAELKRLEAEVNDLRDKLARRQADFENFRKRVERERSELYQRGRDDVLLQFLPVVDNFERALSSLETSEGDEEALRHGVELIHKQFKDALSKFGLEAVEAVGQVFDPHVHEAVTTEATDKHEENTVIEEFQRGYRIGDRLLRPAKVKVASSLEK